MLAWIVALIVICMVCIILIPAFAIVFAVGILGLILKIVFKVLGFGIKITFKAILLVCGILALIIIIL